MIRRATVDELPALSALALRSKAHWGYSASFMAACRDELTVCEDQLEHTHVKQAAWGIAGFYTLALLDGGSELDFLFVEPHAIGLGYGRELLAHARATSLAGGRATMVIQGDPHAARFYQSAGAVLIGEQPSASIPGRMLPLYMLDC